MNIHGPKSSRSESNEIKEAWRGKGLPLFLQLRSCGCVIYHNDEVLAWPISNIMIGQGSGKGW